MKPESSGKIVITNDIEEKSDEETSPIITKKWRRNCPSFGKALFYSRKYDRNHAEEEHWTCSVCGGNKAISKRKERGNLYGHIKNEDYKQHMSRLHSGENNPFYGKRHTEENKKLFRRHSRQMVRTETWKENIGKSHKGKRNWHSWKGGRIQDKSGYVYVYSPGHPNCKRGTPYIHEHRLVMATFLRRPLNGD